MCLDEGVEDYLKDMLPSDPYSLPSFSKDPKNFLGRFTYSISVLHCLPTAMAFDNSEAIGMCIHPHIVKKVAHDAGYEIEQVHRNDFWFFYKLTPEEFKV